jgi:hypothetical protein
MSLFGEGMLDCGALTAVGIQDLMKLWGVTRKDGMARPVEVLKVAVQVGSYVTISLGAEEMEWQVIFPEKSDARFLQAAEEVIEFHLLHGHQVQYSMQRRLVRKRL